MISVAEATAAIRAREARLRQEEEGAGLMKSPTLSSTATVNRSGNFSLAIAPAAAGVVRRINARATLREIQRRWRLTLVLRRMSISRVATAALFKQAFLQFNAIVDKEQRAFGIVSALFDTHVNCIEDQYRERQRVEDDAVMRAAILLPEAASRCSVGLWYTDELEWLRRDEIIAEVVIARAQLKDIEQLWLAEINGRVWTIQSDTRAFESILMRHSQGCRAIERLYDQRRHLEKTENRYRGKVEDEFEQMIAAGRVKQQMLFTESDALISRRRIHAAAVDEFVEIRLSFYPVLLQAIIDAEERRRGHLNTAVARLFSSSRHTIDCLTLQRQEEEIRQRDQRWAMRALGAFSRQYYLLAIRHLEYRERAVRARLWHAFCWQWHETIRGGVTLRLQADEDRVRTSLVARANAARNVLLEALRASMPLALQATEVRARRALQNIYALYTRHRCIDLRLLRLAWTEQQQRNALALRWFVGARDIVVPLSVRRLADLEEALYRKEIDNRAHLWIAEWHAFEAIKFDAVQREQTVRRKAIVMSHKGMEDNLLMEFVNSTHVLAIQHAAKGYRPQSGANPSSMASRRSVKASSSLKPAQAAAIASSSHPGSPLMSPVLSPL